MKTFTHRDGAMKTFTPYCGFVGEDNRSSAPQIVARFPIPFEWRSDTFLSMLGVCQTGWWAFQSQSKFSSFHDSSELSWFRVPLSEVTGSLMAAKGAGHPGTARSRSDFPSCQVLPARSARAHGGWSQRSPCPGGRPSLPMSWPSRPP